MIFETKSDRLSSQRNGEDRHEKKQTVALAVVFTGCKLQNSISKRLIYFALSATIVEHTLSAKYSELIDFTSLNFDSEFHNFLNFAICLE